MGDYNNGSKIEISTIVNEQSSFDNFSYSTAYYNATSTKFDFQLYQRALLKRNQSLAEGFRRIFNYNLTFNP